MILQRMQYACREPTKPKCFVSCVSSGIRYGRGIKRVACKYYGLALGRNWPQNGVQTEFLPRISFYNSFLGYGDRALTLSAKERHSSVSGIIGYRAFDA